MVNRACTTPSVLLVQIQYDPLLDLSEPPASFQALLRRNGFPLMHRLKGEVLQYSVTGMVDIVDTVQWMFASPSYQKSFVLDSETLTLQVFDQERYSIADLVPEYLTYLHHFEPLLGPIYIKRAGVRSAGNAPVVAHLIQGPFFEQLFVPSAKGAEERAFSFSALQETRLQSLGEKGTMQMRMSGNAFNTMYPVDIVRNPSEGAEGRDGTHSGYLLDLDHSVDIPHLPHSKMQKDLESVLCELYSEIEKIDNRMTV